MRPRRPHRSYRQPLVPRGQPRHGHRRQQRAAKSRGDHLADGLQAGRTEVVARRRLVVQLIAAYRQSLVAQAMALIEQQQPLPHEIARGDHRLVAEPMRGRTDQEERLDEQRHRATGAIAFR
jgi:hypothetical protein